MKKLALAAAFAGAITPAHAGGLNEAVMEPEVIEQASSSSGGVILPLLLLLVVAVAISSNGGGRLTGG